jgi:hypothetical protein
MAITTRRTYEKLSAAGDVEHQRHCVQVAVLDPRAAALDHDPQAAAVDRRRLVLVAGVGNVVPGVHPDDLAAAVASEYLFLDKNRRHIGKSQSKRPP